MGVLGSIDGGQLLEVAWVSLLAGVLVTAAFAFVVFSGARSAEARRQGRAFHASLHGGVALISFLAFLAVVGYGVHIILTKS